MSTVGAAQLPRSVQRVTALSYLAAITSAVELALVAMLAGGAAVALLDGVVLILLAASTFRRQTSAWCRPVPSSGG